MLLDHEHSGLRLEARSEGVGGGTESYPGKKRLTQKTWPCAKTSGKKITKSKKKWGIPASETRLGTLKEKRRNVVTGERFLGPIEGKKGMSTSSRFHEKKRRNVGGSVSCTGGGSNVDKGKPT